MALIEPHYSKEESGRLAYPYGGHLLQNVLATTGRVFGSTARLIVLFARLSSVCEARMSSDVAWSAFHAGHVQSNALQGQKRIGRNEMACV
jgi:hypothetical protein